jgi:tetraacyldisaccharide 4'-kinase
MTVRTACYRVGLLHTERMPVPVIVVGNVVVGGGGKTPTTVAIVRHLQSLGHRPGVVSRGHGRSVAGRAGAERAVHVHAQSPAEEAGDEPLLIHQATGVPVVVARQRVQAARALLAAHPGTTVLVCDDGLQHLALHADIGVVVFDERGVGNGWLLPAGLLREPWPSAATQAIQPSPLQLQRAPAPPARLPLGRGPARAVHLVLQSRTHTHALPLPCPPGAVHAWASKGLAQEALNMHGQRVSLNTLIGNGQPPWVAWAGIANPEGFFDMLRAAGVHLTHTLCLNDHQVFDDNFCSELFIKYERKSIFCTQKDAVKLFPVMHQLAARLDRNCQADTLPAVWAVPLSFEPQPAFFQALEQRLSLVHGHQTA